MGRTYIYCRKCGGEYSATPGDYFMATDGHTFKCCRVNSWLVAKGGRFDGDTVLAQRVTVGDLRAQRAVA